MLLSLRASTSRMMASLPSIPVLRPFSTTPMLRTKIPLQASPRAQNPIDLLSKIGRNADVRLSEKAESWEKLTEVYLKGSQALEEAGLNVKERKYIMHSLWRYSQGWELSDFLKSPKRPKKFRAWGPKIQKGYRIKRGKVVKPKPKQ